MQYDYHFGKSLSTLLLCLLSVVSFAQDDQELFQGFEGSANDTWNYTINPATYDIDDDAWAVSGPTANIGPASGMNFWYMRDLENDNGGNADFHTMDFDAVDVSAFSVNALTFKYNTIGYESGDSIGYIVETEPGMGFDMANYVDLSRNTGGWETVFVNLPVGISTVRLRLMAKQNGADDYAGFDDVSLFSSTEDFLPPLALGAELLSDTSIRITYSEPMDVASVENPMNYTTNGTISDITYTEPGGNEFPFVTITYDMPFADGQAFDISIGLVTDAAGNFLLEAFAFDWIINRTTPNLVITEIMYNPPGSSDDLEFVEILNAGTDPAIIGGLTFSSEFRFTFPEQTLAPGEVVLVAFDEAAAEAFYGLDFYDWGFDDITNGDEELLISNFLGDTIDFVNYLDDAPWPTEADGDGPSIELLDPTLDNNDGANWYANTEAFNGTDILATPGVYMPAIEPVVSFEVPNVVVNEADGTVSFNLGITNANGLPTEAVISVVSASTAVAGEDFNLNTTNVTFPANSTDPQSVEVELIDNSTVGGRYLILAIESLTNATTGSETELIVLIQDNELTAPVAPADPAISLSHVGSFNSGTVAEIVAHDPASQRLFLTNSEENTLDVVDFSNPASLSTITAIDMAPYGGGINSVAVANGIVAVALEGNEVTDNGSVTFWDADGNLLSQVEVGPLPDMLTFTPDGTKVLTANEGEPNADYTIDPEGSVSIIDLSVGAPNLTNANVTTISFAGFNDNEASLKDAGVRIFGPGATVAQDLEPEFIVINETGTLAYANCQENNALVLIDIESAAALAVIPLGYKDWTEEGIVLDASNRIDDIFFANWPIRGMYQPDAIDFFTVGGQRYLISANEGDARDYDGYSEEARIGDDEITLDPTAFPNAAYLQNEALLGRLNMTTANGDTDGDGDYDELFTYGARSFSIWNADNGDLVYDSGSELELITAADPVFGAIFNTTDDENSFKNRSDDKGPEPEAVTVAEINGVPYAFIALERIGGLMVYDISNPQAPVFLQYINSRSVETEGGDLAPEDVKIITPDNSPDGKYYAVVSYEVSGTVGVFEIATPPTVTFAESTVEVMEGTGSIELPIEIEQAGGLSGNLTVNVAMASTAVAGEDYNLGTTTLSIPAGSTDALSLDLEVLDNSSMSGKYLILEFDESSTASIGSGSRLIVLIADNDDVAPVAQADPSTRLSHVGSFASGAVAEIVAHDPASQRLFLTNSEENQLDIVDFSNPASLSSVSSVDMAPYGGGINSVAVHNGLVAVAMEANTKTDNGSVVFFDTDGAFLNQVNVGPLPDMLTFTPDGTKVLTANEGEPNDDYDVDPEGSVSIIDVSGGAAAATVVTLPLTGFNDDEATLVAQGVRIFGPGATVAQDLEPEYVTISNDGTTAYVSCQENNALLIVDIVNEVVTGILPLGYKDWTEEGVTLDASNRTDNIFFANWNIKGMYQPDAIDFFTVGGQGYIITANEGDARDYDGYSEEARIGDDEVVLDPTAFPDAAYIKNNALLGRLNITLANGDTDGDGDYDELYAYGARSFTIWDAASGAVVFDSGNDLEQITAADPVFGAIFNATDDENEFKNRSDDKGPEPEAVIVEEIDGVPYAFIALERIGGIMVYEIADPAAPTFIQYINTRTVDELGGDLAPEDIAFIDAADSPDGKAYIAVSYEVSGTVGIFELQTQSTVTFADNLTTVEEGSGALQLEIAVEQAGGLTGKAVVNILAGSTATEGTDFTLASTEVEFDGTNTPQFLSLDILDNMELGGQYIAIEIDAAESEVKLGETTRHIVRIIDNDDMAPVAATNPELQLTHLGSYFTGGGEGTAEIVAFDGETSRLFLTNGENNQVDILDYSNPAAITLISSIDISAYGAGINSVAVSNGIVAAAIEADAVDGAGMVAFFDTDGNFLNAVEVGVLPDMVTFTPDGTKALTANEGEPNDDYDVDPLGSVSIIDLSGGVAAATVTTLGFEAFNDQQAALQAAGVRIFGPGATVAQDLEPEYITISDDGTTAYVNCQENNALVLVDLTSNTVLDILPLGFKDWTADGVTFDASNRTDDIFFANWPVKGMYQPDAIDYFTVGGQSYLISVNEGDARDYDGYSEEARVEDDEYVLDPTTFPDADILKDENLLGRLVVTTANGDTDGDGDFDEIFAFGGRSFTIWDAASGALLFDSGNDLEQITAADPVFGALFNTTDDENNFKNRSDDKGPEPEAVTTAEIDGKHYAFIALERIGGVMVYDVSAPESPVFLQYINTRTVDTEGGDLAPEGLAFIPAFSSPSGKPLLAVSYEVSGSVAMFEIDLSCPIVDLPATVTLCEGETAMLTVGDAYETITWSTGDEGNTIEVAEGGTVTVMATTAGGCMAMDTVEVTVNPLPVVALGDDIEACEGETVTLDAGAGFDTYSWSNDTDGQTLEVDMDGAYAVTVTDANGCSGDDEVVVTFNPVPMVTFPVDTVVCVDDIFVFSPGEGNELVIDGTAVEEFTTEGLDVGEYAIEATVVNEFGCEQAIVLDFNIEVCNSTRDLLTQEGFEVFPNPTTGLATVRLSDLQSTAYDLAIVTSTGQVLNVRRVESYRSDYQAQIDLTQMPAGIYLIRLTSAEGVLTRRLIVE
ncbi:choice-of-anchor I family protein [Phaeodactylibacter xiamenensis]|uniref:choice-of-anchor I family protein n=1 Tax=Phaeodactylibacter xiamenensis TaxID=1524460 RepID=UPI003BAACB3A